MSTNYAGIDYSLGRSNVNHETGIHYGVISMYSVNLDVWAEAEADYGPPTCPECGNTAETVPMHAEQLADGNGVAIINELPEDCQDWPHYRDYGYGCCTDYLCRTCRHTLSSDDVFGDEPLGYSYEADGYKLTDCLDSDIFVLDSPYYTFSQYCSPCVPGAGNLDTPCESGPKTYCLSHDWFEGDKAPYRVYRVADDTEVLTEG